MENKMYDLMEKMYKDFLEFKQTTEANMATKGDVNELKGDVSGLKGDVNDLKGDVNGLKGDIVGLKGDIGRVEQRLDAVETKLDSVERTVLKIEHNHGEKLSALFDGYEQNNQKLDRIEQEVAKHEEFIIKRVQ